LPRNRKYFGIGGERGGERGERGERGEERREEERGEREGGETSPTANSTSTCVSGGRVGRRERVAGSRGGTRVQVSLPSLPITT